MSEITKEYIDLNLLRKDGRINSRKFENGLHKNKTIEDIYLIYYELQKPYCINNQPLKFISFNKGYSKNHECSKERNLYVNTEFANKFPNKKASQSTKNIIIRNNISKELIMSFAQDNGIYNKEEIAKKFNIAKTTLDLVFRCLEIEYIFKYDSNDILEGMLDSKGRLNGNLVKNYDINPEKLYQIVNKTSAPKCKNPKCDNFTEFKSFQNGYRETCCTSCSSIVKSIKKGHIYDTVSFKNAVKEHKEFDYNKVKYVNATTKVYIKCLTHNEWFYTKPQIFVNTQGGCSQCLAESYTNREKKTGWSRERYKDIETILYYINIKGTNIYKIGVTSRSIKERFGKDFEKINVIKETVYSNGAEAFDEEYRILKENKEFKYKGPKLLKSGNSELFCKNILDL